MENRTSATHVADSISGGRILAEATEFAFPRYPGTDGDGRAIEMLRNRFDEIGLETSVEQFSYDIRPAMRVLRVLLIASALLVMGAAFAAGSSPVWGAVLLAAALLPGLIFLAWAPWLEQLYRRDGPTRTANIVGRRRAEQQETTLMVMAHHDSKSQSLTLPFRAGFTLMAIAGALTLLVLVVVAIASGTTPGPGWLPLAAGGASAVAALALSTLRNGNRSPGGVDNAGSVAILLELARVLPGELKDDVELIFLATGAEEDHMVGAMRWLDSHQQQLAGGTVYCLNYDGAGSPGRLVLLERYGFGKLFSAEMSAAARRAAARLGYRLRSVTMPPAMGIDAIPFAHRGIPCLTVSSGSLDRATMAVHSANDRAEHLDAATLEAAARLGLEILVDLAGNKKPGSVPPTSE
jgi:acetylornithine deacetylase/succinyl-diaminopimelate desuccinylase-like protein